MGDYDDSHDPNAMGLAAPVVAPVFMRAFALCRDGFVHAVRSVAAGARHPFGDVEMGVMGMAQDPAREHVVDVTGAVCHPGFIVDNKGNVAPPGNRTEALRVDEPGYHDLRVVGPVPTSELAEIVGRPPLPEGQRAPSPESTDARIDARGEDDKAVFPEGHEHDHGVQEQHDHPVHEDEEAREV